VFLAKAVVNGADNKLIAIKRILPSMAEDEGFIEMFVDEARISGQLSHPNIGQIFEMGEYRGAHFISMEYVWGKDLLQIQNRYRRLKKEVPLEMVVHISRSICEALNHAHRQKDQKDNPLHIIHRDVSPQNILVSYDGEIKLIDFGIAKARSRSSKTQAGVLKGKFGYMSPEQVRALPLDRRSDIFAIGTILYELSTGERLFSGDSDFAVLEKVRIAEVQAPSKINARVPSDLEAIILRALHRDPNRRFQWADEMGLSLNAFATKQAYSFGTNELSDVMHELFADEFQKETKARELYSKISKEDLASIKPTFISKQENAISLLPTLATPTSGIESGEMTLSEGETFIKNTQTSDGAAAGEIQEHHLSESDLLSLKESNIVDDGAQDEPATVIFGEASRTNDDDTQRRLIHPDRIDINAQPSPEQLISITSEPTRILAQNNSTSNKAIPSTGQVTFPPFPLGPGTASHPATVPAPQQPSFLTKDVLIGIGVATFILLSIIVWRLMAREALPVDATASLVIRVVPPKEAQVYLDKEYKGEMKAGIPFAFKDITPKQHQLSLVLPGLPPVHQTVTLKPGEVKTLEIELPVKSRDGTLILKISQSSARVFINGAEVSPKAAKAPLRLTANTPQKVSIENEGYIAQSFSIMLKSEEKLEKVIRLKRSDMAWLMVVTEPSGAVVSLDRTEVGVTPLTLRDLKPRRRYKIEITLGGFERIKQIVSLEAGRGKELNFVLERDRSLERSLSSAASSRNPKKIKRTSSESDSKRSSAREKRENKKVDSPKTSENPDMLDQLLLTKQTDGYLVANTIPWAKVIIDGKDTGKTTPVPPRSKITLSPGKHIVTFEVDGKKFNYPIQIKVGQTLRLVKKLPVD